MASARGSGNAGGKAHAPVSQPTTSHDGAAGPSVAAEHSAAGSAGEDDAYPEVGRASRRGLRRPQAAAAAPTAQEAIAVPPRVATPTRDAISSPSSSGRSTPRREAAAAQAAAARAEAAVAAMAARWEDDRLRQREEDRLRREEDRLSQREEDRLRREEDRLRYAAMVERMEALCRARATPPGGAMPAPDTAPAVAAHEHRGTPPTDCRVNFTPSAGPAPQAATDRAAVGGYPPMPPHPVRDMSEEAPGDEASNLEGDATREGEDALGDDASLEGEDALGDEDAPEGEDALEGNDDARPGMGGVHLVVHDELAAGDEPAAGYSAPAVAETTGGGNGDDAGSCRVRTRKCRTGMSTYPGGWRAARRRPPPRRPTPTGPGPPQGRRSHTRPPECPTPAPSS